MKRRAIKRASIVLSDPKNPQICQQLAQISWIFSRYCDQSRVEHSNMWLRCFYVVQFIIWVHIFLPDVINKWYHDIISDPSVQLFWWRKCEVFEWIMPPADISPPYTYPRVFISKDAKFGEEFYTWLPKEVGFRRILIDHEVKIIPESKSIAECVENSNQNFLPDIFFLFQGSSGEPWAASWWLSMAWIHLHACCSSWTATICGSVHVRVLLCWRLNTRFWPLSR